MKNSSVSGEMFGALAAMLVAFPSAVAFGILVYAPFGAGYAAQGAMAGMIGAVVLGVIGPAIGGAPRLISAPCAPAAAVLGALSAQLLGSGAQMAPETMVLLVTLVSLAAGLVQLLFGISGGGRLIKYIPYPVVAGYLSAVGLLIFTGQLPRLLGVPKGTAFFGAMVHPALWNMPGVIVGVSTIVVMLLASRMTRAIPAPIIALVGGVSAYFVVAMFNPELNTLVGNPLVIGDLQASGAAFARAFVDRWKSTGTLDAGALAAIVVPSLTLAVLLSIDTLKTCVVLDALTRSRHNSNRELIAQGAGNFVSAVFGGMSGAGTMGATLVNISSGGRTRFSGILSGVFSLLALVVFAKFIAWIPVAALAGILIVVAYRMIDKHSFALLKQRSTVLDFVVIAAVVVTAVSFSLIAAAGVGLALAIVLFMRDQIRGSVVRRKMTGGQTFSKKKRLPGDMAVLETEGAHTVVFELQGALFFGTTDQLFTELEPHLPSSKYVILDMRRIGSVDFTAAHLLEQLAARVSEHGGCLIFSHVPQNLPTDHVGLMHPKLNIREFADLDASLEWVEDRVLESRRTSVARDDGPLELADIQVFKGIGGDVIAKLGGCVKELAIRSGEKIFKQGDSGDELFLIRKGSVRIVLPLAGREGHHLASFGRGDFFGDMSFLDGGTRSADAVASSDVLLYVLSRVELDSLAQSHPGTGNAVFSRIARVLALRLRHTDTELRALEEL